MGIYLFDYGSICVSTSMALVRAIFWFLSFSGLSPWGGGKEGSKEGGLEGRRDWCTSLAMKPMLL